MAIDFQSIFDTLKTGTITLAKSTLNDYLDQAKTDGQSILDRMKDDIKNWSEEVVNGDIDKDDLEDLIKGKENLFEMEALQQAGVAQIELAKFKDGLIQLITTTLSNII